MVHSQGNQLRNYFQLLSDLINLTYVLRNHSGNKNLYKNTKKTLNQKIIPKMENLTNKQIELLEELTDDDHPNMFIIEYNLLIESGNFLKAENFSRDWLRYIRDGKSCPIKESYEIW